MGKTSRTNSVVLNFIITIAFCVFFHHHVHYQSRAAHSLYHLKQALHDIHIQHLAYRETHDHVKAKVHKTRERLQHQWEFMHELTSISKSQWVRIKGIPEEETVEEKQNDVEEKVFELMRYVGLESSESVTPNDIERANRIGKRIKTKSSEARIVLVELSSTRLKKRFVEEATRQLRNTGYYITDFLTSMKMAGVDSPEIAVPFLETDEQKKLASNQTDLNDADLILQKCGYIKSIGPPTIIARAKKIFGTFIQDPIGNNDAVYTVDNFYKSNMLEEWATMNDLQSKRLRRKVKLPYHAKILKKLQTFLTVKNLKNRLQFFLVCRYRSFGIQRIPLLQQV